MATPKKRTGKAKQNARRANWKGAVPATTTCPNCKAIVLTHTVCPECGYYKDGFASNKKADAKVETKAEETKVEATEEVKEEKEVKKTRKPRAKKAEVVEEVKAEEAPAEVEEKTEE